MKNKMSNTDQLVEKFWKGETSLQEEKLLKSICQQESFRSRYPDLSDYLQGVEGYHELQMSGAAKKKVLNAAKSGNIGSRVIWAYGLAASFALMLAVFLSPSEKEYTDEEIQLAYQQTRATLLMVSDKMNEGTGYAQNLAHFDRSQQLLQNQIRINSKTK